MRHGLATLYLVWTANAGCSLLYNPNDLPAQIDAMPDMQQVVDANPSALTITNVAPLALIEGQGDGGSRTPVLVLEGMDIAQVGVTVEVVAAEGQKRTPVMTLDTANMQIDAYGTRIAIPITLPVDPDLPAGESIALDIRVTQDAGGTPIIATLTNKLVLEGRNEYKNTGTTVPALVAGVNKFSSVDLSMGTLAAPPTGPVLIEATASITIAGPVVAAFNGTTTTAGAGGNNGGPGAAAQLLSATAGTDGQGVAGGQGGAQAGNPATAYQGDDQLTTINTTEKLANASSGGGGGGVPAVSLTPGGRGGGGGGTVSLLAGGNITIAGTIAANGSAGQTGGVANPGGAGSGGIILVRGGGDVSVGLLEVGGPGVPGRVRVDGKTITGTTTAYRGPTFTNLPLIVNEEKPSFDVTGTPSKGIRYLVIRGTNIDGPFDLTMGSNGQATIALANPLQPGLNEICLLVEAASASTYTRNCATVAHIFK